MVQSVAKSLDVQNIAVEQKKSEVRTIKFFIVGFYAKMKGQRVLRQNERLGRYCTKQVTLRILCKLPLNYLLSLLFLTPRTMKLVDKRSFTLKTSSICVFHQNERIQKHFSFQIEARFIGFCANYPFFLNKSSMMTNDMYIGPNKILIVKS